ncbi:hypothetical protein [Roseivivax sediminis]|uniref:hypothetical protein n=1 Tax=Roseivivax sediminis TaxID=936889 RepID=UPI00122C7D7B|nr:hypothetical protein [Roseivivax sediminis]
MRFTLQPGILGSQFEPAYPSQKGRCPNLEHSSFGLETYRDVHSSWAGSQLVCPTAKESKISTGAAA